ncbi:MAG: RNA chaperone Hfq, partial [Candidatus Obscuribacterales bacterium]|nr:RNA chaperone Hfq [Candidatus Obscuribacterales bacterium]
HKGPSVAEMQRLIREQAKVEFHLVNGDKLAGKIRWFDEHAFSLVIDGQDPMTVLRQAVMAYRVVSETK